MRVIQTVQGSDSWHQLRNQRFTASEAAAACGDHKYMTRNDLLKQKATGIVPDVDAHQQRIFDQGHRFEEMARSIAEEIIGEELFPCTCEDDSETYLASMDGMDMLGLAGWEHKTINESLRHANAETLEDHYKWQMDHQMMVTGAEKILFMASDGTKEDCNWFWYERDESRIKRLIAAWEQFAADLSQYEAPEPEQPKAEGKTPDALPALSVQVQGMVTASNLKEFEASALAALESINTDLQTDNDFADAEKAAKFCKDVEKRLKATKEQVIGQMVSVDEVVRLIDSLDDQFRQKRLIVEKAVKAQKEQRKQEILMAAKQGFDAFLRGLDVAQYMQFPMPDFAGAMKGKKTISSLKSGCDDLTAQSKIEANEQASVIRDNLKQLDEHAADYRFLFSDLQQIVTKPAGDFAAIIKARIADHKEAEQKRLDAEREKIRQEEEARVKRESEQKARQEAEAKARADTAADSAPTEKKPAFEMPPLKPEPSDSGRMGDASQQDDKVLIDRAEYSRLLDDSAMLAALMAAGVDSWEGYDMAIEMKQEAA